MRLKESFSIFLNEEFLGRHKDHEYLEFFKNPSSIKKMEPNLRAISDKKGNLFVCSDPYLFDHVNISSWLYTKGINLGGITQMINDGILWERNKNTDEFWLSRAYLTYGSAAKFDPVKLEKHTKKNKSKTSKKNPNFKFVLKILNNEEDPFLALKRFHQKKHV